MSNQIIGIDEVGRGPVAGPVYVCAMKMSVDFYEKFKNSELRDNFLKNFINEKGIEIKKIPPLRDSKKLTKNYKNDWIKIFKALKKAEFLDYNIVSFKNTEIDKFGIAKCIQKSVIQVLKNLKVNTNDTIKLDGSLFAPLEFKNQETLIKGDDLEPIISGASIVAKVARDDFMTEQAVEFPQYYFEKNMGYGTVKHMQAIKTHGTCPLHRISFLKKLA
jgi:ribonuclease HII